MLRKLDEREMRGSTFLNVGIGLPHARTGGLTEPQIAIAATHAGVLDAPTTSAVEFVVLLLTPIGATSAHLQLLSAISRRWQSRELQAAIREAERPEEVIAALRKPLP